MDSETKHVRDFLISMRPVREALGDLVRQLYHRPLVHLVHQYDPKASLSYDFGVSAELRNAAVVDFWIELDSTDSGWIVKSSVLRHDPDEEGSHSELDFPDQPVVSVSELPSALLVAIVQLQQASASNRFFR